jgi:hypothetical protein
VITKKTNLIFKNKALTSSNEYISKLKSPAMIILKSDNIKDNQYNRNNDLMDSKGPYKMQFIWSACSNV